MKGAYGSKHVQNKHNRYFRFNVSDLFITQQSLNVHYSSDNSQSTIQTFETLCPTLMWVYTRNFYVLYRVLLV
jgi:hypothetical protein